MRGLTRFKAVVSEVRQASVFMDQMKQHAAGAGKSKQLNALVSVTNLSLLAGVMTLSYVNRPSSNQIKRFQASGVSALQQAERDATRVVLMLAIKGLQATHPKPLMEVENDEHDLTTKASHGLKIN